MTPRFAALVLAVASALTGCAVGDRADEQAAVAEGARLYEANCMQCHGGSTGGSIEDIPPRHNAEGHTWHHPDCELVAIVLEGMPQRADLPEMPAFEDRLTEDDVSAILAYLTTWWEPDQREFQEQVTEQVC